MKSPLISVAVCTYQGEKFLKEQLDSLISQTYHPFEIVIHDDHSNDGTWEIIELYQSKFPNLIRTHRNRTRLGIKTNFQLAFNDCKGELIAPCDQDDLWHPKKLELMSTRIKNHLLIYHDSELIDASGNRLGTKISDKFRFIKGSDPTPFLLFNCVSGHSMLFHQSLLKDALPFPQVGYHDHWLVYMAAEKGSIDYMEESLVFFRQHDRNASGYGKRRKYKNRFTGAKNRMVRENLWLQACSELPKRKSSNSLESRIFDLAYSREKSYVVPKLGWTIWKNRKRLFAMFPYKLLKHLAMSFRYSWGLKIKKLIYLSA
ncbi:glycosyltransferase family 2 protein [Algoriphagus lacus]|uniref:Glycosyltransferase family 2 protein n=1 Tax=Algoriphagus lacus TaxID=2056311 RepID=A0A418PNG5_9BACT|nr:glycosyltransferase family 2 protein [Algoriphagus lacus]RIW13389.1 glycosyltransferase family 2 protein [Algoriphagus lacus]